MSAELIIHGFETSNNIKVRIALGYKGIPYTFRPIDPKNRDTILELSGQRLTPLMQHGDVVLFDSAAIIRYLEANFPGTPGLFGTSHAQQWLIEDVELFARAILAGPMMEVVHARVTGGTVDDAMQERCARTFADAVGKLAETLGGRTWLVGESLSIADITAAAVMYRVRSGQIFAMPPAAAALQDWEDRVTAHDAHLKRA